MFRVGILVSAVFLFLPSFAAAGNQIYNTPGTYTFTVPSYATLKVTVGGGGGGSGNPTSGWITKNPESGGDSSFLTVVGGGGQYGTQGGGGAPGVGSGGDSNANGGQGVNGSSGGGPGGPGAGTGGNGSVGCVKSGCYYTYGGGGGGWAEKTYAPGALMPGSTVTVIAGGGGAYGCQVSGACGNSGTGGSVIITWDDAPEDPTPTCSITFDENPIVAEQSTTIHWESTNAESFHIDNIGYVNGSGQAQVTPSETTNYKGTATNASGEVTCAGMLVVTAPIPVCIRSCPSGYTLQGDECVLTSCPSGHTIHNGQCVSIQCPVVQAGGCSAGFVCRGNDVWRRNALCVETFDQTCPYGCSAGGCILPSNSGNIRATPALVRSGGTSNVSWETSGMEAGSCTVTGDNGDGPWTGNTGSRASSPITGQTTYTLSCTTTSGAPFVDTVKVGPLPVFQEV